jgi:hypothetical protein
LNQDISSALAGWDFDPDQLQVRLIVGGDGLEKIQMRIDLGLIQMEIDGRPDGQRPEGFESQLDLHEARAAEAANAKREYPLSSDDCVVLMREGLQFYHRYLSAFHLGRYDIVARDTARNLRLFAFVGLHATEHRDKLEFDQYRPYVEMMHTRALASQAIEDGDHALALSRIDDGIAAIRRFLNEYHEEGKETECQELRSLVRWRREVERKRPKRPLEQLEQLLEVSVRLEDYEQAARIRDQIRQLHETGADAETDATNLTGNSPATD